jgi:hypothetical protein
MLCWMLIVVLTVLNVGDGFKSFSNKFGRNHLIKGTAMGLGS